MKSTLINITWLLISLSCICGMCSKGEEANNNNNTNINTDPVLAPEATWVYFDESPSLVQFHTNNNRPLFKKWVATKINTGYSGYTGSSPAYLAWSFENNGDTRFLQNIGNPSGKEAFSIFLKKFNKPPGPGSYQMDVDNKEGYCWYYVYNSSGAMYDSTRSQAISNSVFNITSMSFDKAIIPTVDRYKMTGTATFNIMYWPNGTGSTTDIHKLRCTFNNIPVDVMK